MWLVGLGAAYRTSFAQEPADARFSTVVTASRTAQRQSEAATPIDVITRVDIERSGARDLAEVLALHPAVQLERSFAGAGVYVQGLEPQHVLILIDGQRMIGRTNGVIDLSRIPVERIEQVEVSRGASSVLYGSDALGGVINIVTRSAKRKLEGSAQVQYGGLNALDLRGSGGLRFGVGGLVLTAGWHRRDAYQLDPQSASTSGGAFDEQQVSGKLDLRPTAAFRVGTALSYLRRRMDGVDSTASGAVLDRTNLTETIDASITPELRLGRFTLKGVVQYSHFRDQYLLDQRRGTQLDSYQQTREHLLRGDLQLDVRLPLGQLLTAGGELLYERLYTPRLATGEGDRLRGAVFVQDQWQVAKAVGLSLVPALRFDVDSQFGTNWAPKLALRFAPLPALTARFGYGAGFRAPQFKELLLLFENAGAGYLVSGNTSLRPETSHSFNLGIESAPVPWLQLSGNLFRNNLRNLIQPLLTAPGSSAGPQRFSYGNIAEAYTQGVELSAKLRHSDKFGLELGYTLTDAWDVQQQRALEPHRAADRKGADAAGERPGAEVAEVAAHRIRKALRDCRMAPHGHLGPLAVALPQAGGAAHVVRDRDEDVQAVADERVEPREDRIRLGRKQRIDGEHVLAGSQRVAPDLGPEGARMPLGMARSPAPQACHDLLGSCWHRRILSPRGAVRAGAPDRIASPPWPLRQPSRRRSALRRSATS